MTLDWVKSTLNYGTVVYKWLKMNGYEVSCHEDKSYGGQWDEIKVYPKEIAGYSISTKSGKNYYSITDKGEIIYVNYSGGLMFDTHNYLRFLAKEMQKDRIKTGWFFCQRELSSEDMKFAIQCGIKLMDNSKLATYPKIITEDKEDKAHCNSPLYKIKCPIISTNLNDPTYTWLFATYYIVKKLFEDTDKAYDETKNIEKEYGVYAIKTYKNKLFMLVYSSGFPKDVRFSNPSSGAKYYFFCRF